MLLGNRWLLTVTLSLFAFLATAGSAQAAIISYGGDATPDSPLYGPTFTTAVFGGTSWSSDGDVLTMQTAVARGIWFGNQLQSDMANWSISDNAVGNKVTLRSRLEEGSTEWNFYLFDGSYTANFYLLDGGVQIQYAGPGGALATADISLDTNQFHVYEMLLRDGLVSYRVDGQTLFAGPAKADNASRVLVVGDGSGSSISGVGQMQIDYLTIDTQPTEFVPEPATLPAAAWGALLACGALAMARRRRRRLAGA